MDLVVEHLLVEVHRCSSFFPTRFSGWPTSSTAGMMSAYGAQCELRRIYLLGTGVKIALVAPHFHPPVVARGAMGNWCENSLLAAAHLHNVGVARPGP